MHNPRGSNDRNCERNVNRNNENRLFDSQNNNNGGYACQRPVGDETMQNEMGIASFSALMFGGGTQTFTQSKRMYYYEGSILPIEWTNQHGCGSNSKVNCEIVLQYACEDTLDPRVDNFWPWVKNKAGNTSTYYGKQHFRDVSTTPGNIAAPRDGVPIDSNDAATDTINNDEASAIPNTAQTRRYGMQESFDYYTLCQQTERNKGLYVSDQLMRRNDRRATRQNPNGNRHGFECPEERDYYPWWAPSPWIDIAVLSDSAADSICYPYSTKCTKRCEYYMNNTMNIHKKGYCDVNHNTQDVSVKLNSQAWNQNRWYNNRAACEANGFKWYMISHADNLVFGAENFVCAHTQFSRVNQLGNARNDDIVSQTEAMSLGNAEKNVVHGVNANRFLWTIPKIPTPRANPSTKYFSSMTNAYQSCVLRMRYNVSSSDFQQWPVDAVNPGTSKMVDSHNNSKSQYDTNTPLHQNPYIYIAPGANDGLADMFVNLKVNTNQYGRTFQDRSYVFSIKPKPTASVAASNFLDTPAVDYAAMTASLAAGGKIYNVNVRGKRGNIVQVYPSVEYDFTPNALALSTNDMIHFQWTGSDYNPRRGCNDATGGPPDLNTFSTDANADQNSRADRSNIVFTNHMANNVPKDYLGYSHTNTNLTWAQKRHLAKHTVLQNVPCYNPATDSAAQASACYNQTLRLAYLNQQEDGGSLILRANKPCLTQTELDNIQNQDTARSHPLNCAKMNAKPYPYFDGGIMMMNKPGWYSFFSSRNNNFSNRQNIGIICVGPGCKLMNGTGVLQDVNPGTSGTALVNSAASKCSDTANTGVGNSNGATSCLTTATPTKLAILTAETFTISEGDNDAAGDGNLKGCAVVTYTFVGTHTVEQRVALAIGLLFAGLFCAWLAYYLYNRYQARLPEKSRFRYMAAWQNVDAAELAASTTKGGAAVATAVEMKENPSKGTPPSISVFTAGKSGAAASAPSAPPTSPPKPMARMPSRGPTSPTGASGAKPGRVLSAKRQRPRHEEMI